MLHISNLRSSRPIGFILGLKRAAATLALLFLLPLAVSAYTVVMRNGRRVEIPANFQITRAGITYEYAPGIYVTIQMSGIDAQATERANNEPEGSLLRRAEEGQRAVASQASTSASTSKSEGSTSSGARRTLTDKELESTRARREASEAAYERRRRELGLPSLEETRRQREEEAARLSEMAAQSEASQAQSEAYWRERASELRTAMAATDAQIDYLRSQLQSSPGYLPSVTYTSVSQLPIGAIGFPGTGFPGAVFPGRIPRRGFPSAPPGIQPLVRALPTPAPPAGRAPLARALPNTQRSWPNNGSNFGFNRRGFRSPGIALIPLSVSAPYNYGYSYDESYIAVRLQALEAERASLLARWRLLEEEARRAGAQPGWLRP